MAKIRVIPSLLLEAANELQRIISEVEAVGDQVQTAASRAPSYEGQFGPKVHSLRSEAIASSRKLAQDLSTLANVLRNKGEDFESADLAGAEGLAGILAKFEAWLSSDRLLALDEFPIDFVSGILILGTLLRPRGEGPPDEEPEWKPPWYGPMMIELSKFWSWYDQTINRFIYQDIGLQVPGFPKDGPITPVLNFLSETDASGNPKSIVGSEVVRLIERQGGIFVWFSNNLTGGGAGVAPMKRLIWLPDSFANPSNQIRIFEARITAHELEHLLQRELPEYPDGTPTLTPRAMHTGSWPWNPEGFRPFDLSFEYGAPLIGDFTLYMEVQSNIVENAVHYELLDARRSELLLIGDPQNDIPAIDRTMAEIVDSLATYTGDAEVACAYVVHESGAYGMYVGEMVKELSFGPRIPPGGWEYWLQRQGFSEESIQRITDIANQGTPIDFPTSDIFSSQPQISQGMQPSEIPTPSTHPTSTPNPSGVSDTTGSSPTDPTQTPTPTPSPGSE
jgi:hypothetical protein